MEHLYTHHYYNTRVKFLPKNTTALLQPLDLDKIATIKKRYKTMIAEGAADLIDARYIDTLYKIELP